MSQRRTRRWEALRVFAGRLASWQAAFEEYAERLCRHPLVLQAYLAGSRARGDALPASDYDVVVVVPDGTDKLEAAVELRRLKPRPFPLDLIVLWESEARDPVNAELLAPAKPLCPTPEGTRRGTEARQ